MKNIYVRAGMSPFESFPAEKILNENSIGTNVGNFLYLFGTLRNLVQEDTIVTPSYYKLNHTKEEIDRINQECDCFLIPLADAFRPDFRGEMRALTRLVEQLTIPCVVTGVGLCAPYDASPDQSYPFDEDAKAFVKAVLNKSAKIGVRGEITSAYLSHLGFREGIDHTPIGCPSLYMNGPKLQIREANITPDSFVCYNTTFTTPDNVHEFVHRSLAQFHDTHFVPQVRNELKLLYTGAPYICNANPLYPTKITDEAYRGNQSRFFLNVPTWIEYMKGADFCFGTRLHGNVAAMLAGTPSILLAKDARVRELAEYHDMTRFPVEQIDEKTDIWDLIAKADFHQAEKCQYANYTHFIDFLEENHLSPYRQDPAHMEELPFEERMKHVKLEPPVESIATCSLEEMAKRWGTYWPLQEQRVNRLETEVKTLKKEKKEFQGEAKKLQQEKTVLQAENKELQKETSALQAEKKTLAKEKKRLQSELEKPLLIQLGKRIEKRCPSIGTLLRKVKKMVCHGKKE